MTFPSRYALLVLAPLAVSMTGCAGSLGLAQSGRHRVDDKTLSQQRLMAMARVYERKGELEYAHRFYCQVLQADPSQAEAREHAENLLLAMREVHEAKPPEAPNEVPAVAQEPKPLLAKKTSRPRRARLLTEDELAARVPSRRSRKPLSEAPETAIAAATEASEPGVEQPGSMQLATVTPKEIRKERRENVRQAADAVSVSPQIPENVLPLRNESVETGFFDAEEEAALDAQEAIPVIQPVGAETVVFEPELEIVAEPQVIAAKPATAVAEPQVVEGAWKPTSLANMCPDASDELRAELQHLSSDDADVRKAAIEMVVAFGDDATAAGPALKACLSDSDPVVRAYAAWAVWEILQDEDAAVTTLRKLLDSPNDDAVTFACYVLGTMGNPAERAIEDLARTQNHKSAMVRAHAAEALLKISDGNSGSVVVLSDIMQIGASDERALSVLALSAAKGLDRKVAIDTLIAAINDPSPEVRSSPALTLGSFGRQAQRASVALERAAAMADEESRVAFQTALACIRS